MVLGFRDLCTPCFEGRQAEDGFGQDPFQEAHAASAEYISQVRSDRQGAVSGNGLGFILHSKYYTP
jgi:hypothetical protein